MKWTEEVARAVFRTGPEWQRVQEVRWALGLVDAGFPWWMSEASGAWHG